MPPLLHALRRKNPVTLPDKPVKSAAAARGRLPDLLQVLLGHLHTTVSGEMSHVENTTVAELSTSPEHSGIFDTLMGTFLETLSESLVPADNIPRSHKRMADVIIAIQKLVQLALEHDDRRARVKWLSTAVMDPHCSS